MKSTITSIDREIKLVATTILVAMSVVIFQSCDDDEEQQQPVIESFSPASAAPGTNVTISGLHFGSNPELNEVKFNEVAAAIVSASTTQIVATVPASATSGKITVAVNELLATSANDFGVFQSMSNFSPVSGIIGTTVTINGLNFDPTPGNNTVKFNGVAANVTAATATQLTATVPLSATTGPVSVTTNGNTVTSTTNFTILAPAITDFSPSSAVTGTTITINGSNFSSVPSENIVRFNNIDAGAALTATATSLTVVVPANATSGKIKVTTNGVEGLSSTDFTVLVPSISDFTPTSGAIGTTITITGANFSTTPSNNVIKINGADAGTAITATATTLTAIVPATATTGKVTVIVDGKVCESQNDFVIGQPLISKFFPAIASAGRTVLLSGTNFSPVIANNIVKFNGVTATVTAATSTELAVTVPADATNGQITLNIGSQSTTAAGNFELCTGSAELVISNIVITNGASASSYFIRFTITNSGSADANISKMIMQNYASADATVGNDLGASGYALTTAGVLAPGQSYTTSSMGCSIGGGTKTSHPYLILTLFDAPEGSVVECNEANNIVITPFNQ